MLGFARLQLNEPRSAGAEFRRALAIRERALGPFDPLVGVSVGSVATVEWYLGDKTAAARSFERALAIVEKNLDTKLDQFAQITEALATLRSEQDPKGAEALLRRAMAIVEQRRGRRDVAYLDLVSALYTVLASVNRENEITSKLEALGASQRCIPKEACAEAAAAPSSNSDARPGAPVLGGSDASSVVAGLRPAFKACVDAGRARDRRFLSTRGRAHGSVPAAERRTRGDRSPNFIGAHSVARSAPVRHARPGECHLRASPCQALTAARPLQPRLSPRSQARRNKISDCTMSREVGG